MISAQAPHQPLSFRFGAFCAAPQGGGPQAAGVPPLRRIGSSPSGFGYSALLAAFRASGGIARGDDLARLLEYLDRGDFISLARLIAERKVFGFAWGETWWIPMFQFELHDLSLSARAQAVVAELSGAYNGWPLACWFAEPNDGLRQRRPVDLLRSDLPAVLEAARADRLVAHG